MSKRIINYINEKIGFYFECDFHQMIIDFQLNYNEYITKYGSLAVLFNHCFGDVSEFSAEEKEDAYTLVEDLYTSLEVNLMFDGSVKSQSIDELNYEICSGYGFDHKKYIREIEKGVALVESKGIDLYKLIK